MKQVLKEKDRQCKIRMWKNIHVTIDFRNTSLFCVKWFDILKYGLRTNQIAAPELNPHLMEKLDRCLRTE